MINTIQELLGRPDARNELRERFNQDPKFCHNTVELLLSQPQVSGLRFAMHLLVDSNALPEYLSDPLRCPQDRACSVIMAAREVGAPVEAKLGKYLNSVLQNYDPVLDGPRVIRLVELLFAVGATKEALLLQNDLLSHSDARIRSKSALLFGRIMKSPQAATQRFFEGEHRVTANAVEALWDFKDEAARKVFENAIRADHPRIVANGLIGLYRAGLTSSISGMLKMAQHRELSYRVSAYWAIGETGDSKFMPFLNRQFKQLKTPERFHITKAMCRIRRAMAVRDTAGQIDIKVANVEKSDTQLKIQFSLFPPAKTELSHLRPTAFTISFGDEPVPEYSVRSLPDPPVAIVAFILPRAALETTSFGQAMLQGFERCLNIKRDQDLWTARKYLLDDEPVEKSAIAPASAEEPVDRAARRRGHFTDLTLLQKVVSEPGSRANAESDPSTAMPATLEAVRASGSRHAFLILLSEERRLPAVASIVAQMVEAKVTPHIFAGEGCEVERDYRRIAAETAGTFDLVTAESLPEILLNRYAGLFHRYEAAVAGGDFTGTLSLAVDCSLGRGSALVPWNG